MARLLEVSETASFRRLTLSVNSFFSGDARTTDGFQNVDDPRANVYLFAGLQGRFALFGDRRSTRAPAVARAE